MLDSANQQISSSWIAGIIEGEGSVTCNKKKSNEYIAISNTDLDIIWALEDYLKINNIYYTLDEHKRNGKKKEYNLRIRNISKCIFNYPRLLYDLIENKIECRKEAFQKLFGFSEITSTLSVDFDWLIGIMEAESSLSIIRNNRGLVAFKIEISNTNFRILEKVAKNLHVIGCTWQTSDKIKKSINHKQAKVITICGMKNCLPFLIKTKNKWICKRNIQRSNLMLEFIYSRFRGNKKRIFI